MQHVNTSAPLDLTEIEDSGLTMFMRSYANSLILKPMVYVPRFRKPQFLDTEDAMAIVGGDGSSALEWPDAALLPQYEEVVKKAYESAGLKVVWIDADQTIPYLGSIHCLTMQIAQLPTK